MKEKKTALVDVAVQINIWIRPELQRKQFEIIKEARPSILFLASDGGRNENEWELIYRNRKMYDEEIDWDCTVFKMYMSSNNGLYSMCKKCDDWVWSHVDSCIFLEDDDIPAVSFFKFCKEMLDRYADDYRIQAICGFNPLNNYQEVSADYFFTGMCNPWGIARWKRTGELLFDKELKYFQDPYIQKLMRRKLGRYTYDRAMKCAQNGVIDGHIPWVEFYFGIARATQNSVFIMPKKNLISNYGCGVDSIHSSSYRTLSKTEQSLFYSKVYELTEPIKHPKYVICDDIFQKKVRRILGTRNPITKFYRRVVKTVKMLRFEGAKGLNAKIIKLQQNRKER